MGLITDAPPGGAGFEHDRDGVIELEVLSPGDLSASERKAWDELASEASSPNPFYERWNLLTAVEHLCPTEPPLLVLAWRRSEHSGHVAQLCGLFPLTRVRTRIGLSGWGLWGHDFAYLRTPLLRRGCEHGVLSAFFDWLSRTPNSPQLLDLEMLDGDGPVAEALWDVVNERRLSCYAIETYSRALLTRVNDWPALVGSQLSKHHRRELRRLARRMSELGEVSVCTLESADQLEAGVSAFLKLEASGWKGNESTAVACSEENRRYFQAMLRGAFDEGRLQMLSLCLEGEPIAMKINLLSGRGAFAFKIAYDERFGKYSPGVQLELENIRLMHEATSAEWMDSCARSNHFMINRLWSRRRIIQRLLISTGGRLGHLAVGAYPILRACKRSLGLKRFRDLAAGIRGATHCRRRRAREQA